MVLVVRRDEVQECMRREPAFGGALSLLEDSFRELSLPNRVVSYREERTRLRYPPGVDEAAVEKDLWIMPMYVPAIGCGAIRIGTGDDSLMAVYDFQNMGLQGLIQDMPLDPLRAGLPLALAAKYLAPPTAEAVVFRGGGPGDPAALAGMAGLHRIKRVLLGSHPLGYDGAPAWGVEFANVAEWGRLEIQTPPSVSLADAEIVVLAPDLDGQVHLSDEDVRPGQLIATTDPGVFAPETRARATVIHASRAHAPTWASEAGPVVELGDVFRGEHPGRTRDDEIILFVSPPNIGFYDVATSWWCYQVARQHGLGVDVPLVVPLEGEDATGL